MLYDKGFTLLEMLVAMALTSIVIGIIYAMITPLNEGIKRDQKKDGVYADFQIKVSALESLLRNGKKLEQYDEDGFFSWSNAQGEVQQLFWEEFEEGIQVKLNQGLLLDTLLLSEFSVDCLPSCESGLRESLINFDLKLTHMEREFSVRWRP